VRLVLAAVGEQERPRVVGDVHVVDAALGVAEDDLGRPLGAGGVDDADAAPGRPRLGLPEVAAHGVRPRERVPGDEGDAGQVAERERLGPGPVARRQPDPSHPHAAGAFEFDRQSALGLVAPRREQEADLPPPAGGDADGRLGQGLAVGGLGGQEDAGRPVAPRPKDAPVGPPRDQRHARTAAAGVDDADLALAGNERETLAPAAGGGALGLEGKRRPDRPPADGTPRAGHLVARRLGHQGNRSATAAGTNPEPAEPGLTLPRPEAHGPFGQRVVLVLIRDNRLARDRDRERRAGHPDGQRHPFAHGHRTGDVLEVLVVLPVPAKAEKPAGGVQGNLVPVEPVGADAGIGDPDDEAGVAGARGREKDLHAHLARRQGRPVVDEFRAGPRRGEHLAVLDLPPAAIGRETRHGMGKHGLPEPGVNYHPFAASGRDGRGPGLPRLARRVCTGPSQNRRPSQAGRQTKHGCSEGDAATPAHDTDSYVAPGRASGRLCILVKWHLRGTRKSVHFALRTGVSGSPRPICRAGVKIGKAKRALFVHFWSKRVKTVRF